MLSKPLPPGLFGPVGISELEPSDSPGGLTQTYAWYGEAPMPGRMPMPAPFWLHQSPFAGRRSIRLWLTKVFTSVDVLAAVGRQFWETFGPPPQPPQPLRLVSDRK